MYYNLNGKPALDAYMEKTAEKNIPIAYFAPIADIDEKVDLAHAISCMRAIEQAARYQNELFVPKRVLSSGSISWAFACAPRPTRNTTRVSTSTSRVLHRCFATTQPLDAAALVPPAL